MELFIGTSGYSYQWNVGKSLAWYINQGFKTVEINSTFYRFPFATMVKRWSSVPGDFFFSIKVNRSLSHYSKLKNIDLWEKFRSIFRLMDSKIKFWLIQMPPGYSANKSNLQAVLDFIGISGDKRLVFEFRDPSWWNTAERIVDAGAVFCSVDAPLLPSKIINSGGTAYVRVHGRNEWYSYNYTKNELDIIVKSIINSGAHSGFVYINNDVAMLENALYLLRRYK
ncbi:MAG: DUF72 domain-containing protein [Nitrososphaeria archaeon]